MTLCVVSLVLGNLTSSSFASAESFDKPVRKTVVELGPPSLMPSRGGQIQLSCFYYPDFMVKQLVDPSEKGTQWVTIDPVRNGDSPGCRQSHSPMERFIAEDGWFFIGAKGSRVFLEAADGTSGGMPFRILDQRTGKKIFEDSMWGRAHFEFLQESGGKLTVRYLRLVEGDCSLAKDEIGCWNKFREKYGLANATVPKCMGYRREGEREWVPGDEGVPPAEITNPSALVYPVLLEFSPRPSIKAAQGTVRCFPVD